MELVENADAGEPLEEADGDAEAREHPAEGFERWRRESALGSVGTGIARGLQYVFQPPQDEPVMVAPVPGDPPDPDRLQVILDPDDPTKSIVVIPPSVGDADPG
ncbi:MAG TPA: hypothetical protein VIY26_15475 [Acidimicrobiales bacterium]